MAWFFNLWRTLALIAIAVLLYMLLQAVNACCDKLAAGGGGTGSGAAAVFNWHSPDLVSIQSQTGFGGPGTRPMVQVGGYSGVDRYVPLAALHKPARIVDVAFMRFWTATSYTGTIEINLVVQDQNGNVLRTISSSSTAFDSAAPRSWTAIPLSSAAADLEIAAGEVVAAELVFSTPPPTGMPPPSFPYVLSARGAWL